MQQMTYCIWYRVQGFHCEQNFIRANRMGLDYVNFLQWGTSPTLITNLGSKLAFHGQKQGLWSCEVATSMKHLVKQQVQRP